MLAINLPGSIPLSPDRWRDGGLSAGVMANRAHQVPIERQSCRPAYRYVFCSRNQISQAINQYRGSRMSMRRQSARIRKGVAVGARRPEVVVDPLFVRAPTKAELREQAAEAVATYEGPITRCPPKRRRMP